MGFRIFRGRAELTTSTKSIYRHSGFLRFWSAVTISGIGGQVTLIALPLTAVLTLHASPVQLGLLAAAQTAPVIIVTPLAGVVADRFPVRLVNSLCDVARGLVLLIIPLLTVAHLISLSALYFLAVILGSLKALADVAHHSMLPHIVSKEEIVPGNAAVNTAYSVTGVAGPGLGGLLVGLFTAPYALIVDSVSFLISGGLISSLRTRPTDSKPARQSWWKMASEGFKYLIRERGLLALALCSGTTNLFIQAYSTVLVIYVVQSLGLLPVMLGTVYACGAVGGMVGAALARRLAQRVDPPTLMLCSLAVTGTAFTALSTAALFSSDAARIAVLIGGSFISTCSTTIYNVHAVSSRQQLARRDMLGRVTASYRLLSHGTMPLGALLGGLCASALGPGPAIALSGTAIVVWIGTLFLTPFRDSQRRAEEKSEPAAATAH
ncbi:MFS transporter [Streptomyces sp. NPDC056503]|uniref:MFS transporter n=1 Tax=Streptomyces sp. NPDC056503 TaxID=3345842 RepID=UPI0036CC0EE9